MLTTQSISIPMDGTHVHGDLVLADQANGVILFAHGSGSSRHSPRNRFVAEALQQASFGTLLMDLLTEAEEDNRGNVFDIGLLAERLLLAASWLRARPTFASLPLGLFGASTGSAAALVAAARRPEWFSAVVSRGGRPDLARDDLRRVQAPTLLIVGSHDPEVLQLNEDALARLRCPKDLQVINGASHLFPEPGALEAVADLATCWFESHLLAKPVFPAAAP